MTEEELEESEDSKKIFVWYYDVFLPAAVNSNLQYGPSIRYYKEYTDLIPFYKKERVAVPVQVEAFALLIYSNCVDKWNFQYQQKEANPNSKIQAHCEANRGKYTYIAKGEDGAEERRKAVCGFTKAGQDEYAKLRQIIRLRREKDKANGTPNAKLALKLMRLKHKIGADTPSQAKPAKKRRVEKEAPTLPPQELLDEEED